MKIYVNEESQEVRIDFGEDEYARASVSRYTEKVLTEVCPAEWLPDVLGDSELVYETPAPPLQWPGCCFEDQKEFYQEHKDNPDEWFFEHGMDDPGYLDEFRAGEHS